MSRLSDLDRAALVVGSMAAGASRQRSTYDHETRTWTTHHGRTDQQTAQDKPQR